jgi:hypothetical protein
MKTILNIEGIQINFFPADNDCMEIQIHCLEEDEFDEIDPDCKNPYVFGLSYENVRYLADALLRATDHYQKNYIDAHTRRRI